MQYSHFKWVTSANYLQILFTYFFNKYNRFEQCCQIISWKVKAIISQKAKNKAKAIPNFSQWQIWRIQYSISRLNLISITILQIMLRLIWAITIVLSELSPLFCVALSVWLVVTLQCARDHNGCHKFLFSQSGWFSWE